MPSFSLAGGVDASYAVAAGKTTVVISSNSHLKHRAVYVGTGKMTFHWVSTGKTEVWECNTTMLGPAPVEVEEKVGADGRQELEVELVNVYPAGLLLQGRMVGTLMAPAVHVDVPWGTDVWVFLVRSPWFPLKLQVDKPTLSVEHGTAKATAGLGLASDGGLTGQIAVDGVDFKSASLVVRRTLGSFSSDESICEFGAGTQTFAWKPIMRAFDLVLVTKGSITESEIVQVTRGLGAQVSSGLFEPGSTQGDFVLCDGPAMSYTLFLKGHRGFLENEEDRTDAKFTW